MHEKSILKSAGLDFRSIRFPGVISYDTIPSGGTTDYAPQMIDCAKKGVMFECKLTPKTTLPFIGIDKTIASIIDIMNFKVIDSKLRVFNNKLVILVNFFLLRIYTFELCYSYSLTINFV